MVAMRAAAARARSTSVRSVATCAVKALTSSAVVVARAVSAARSADSDSAVASAASSLTWSAAACSRAPDKASRAWANSDWSRSCSLSRFLLTSWRRAISVPASVSPASEALSRVVKLALSVESLSTWAWRSLVCVSNFEMLRLRSSRLRWSEWALASLSSRAFLGPRRRRTRR